MVKQIEKFRKIPAESLVDKPKSQGPNEQSKTKNKEEMEEAPPVTCWWKQSSTAPTPLPAHSRSTAMRRRQLAKANDKDSPLSISRGQADEGVDDNREPLGLAASDTKVG